MTKKKMEKYAKALDFRAPVRNLYGYYSVVAPDGHLIHCNPLLPSRQDAERCLQECFFYRDDLKKIDIDLGLSFWRLWEWRHRELFPRWNPPAKAFKRMKDTLEGYMIAGKPAIQWCNL